MALAPGQRVGQYEVISQLGAGGMGEVYRARDARLKRDVAIKVLPADVAGSRERLARFQREAEVLASLNHPHIAHVYGIEDAALVMELVEGEDLAQRLARGPIPLDEALPIARQIAEALEAAHDQGIVHRDLKPANIKLTGDGTVKVLDFGLAKALEPATGSSPELANSPTITSPAVTGRGVILGTAAYMSPEQAKGKPVDKRADVWAFGAVLYEMLTSQRAFKGDDVTDTITSVMRDTPDWNALPPATPFAIRRLLQRCLEKDPRKRAAHMSVARLEIDDATLATGELMHGYGAMPTAAKPRSYALPIVAAVCTVLALATGWASGRYFSAAPPAIRAPMLQFNLTAPQQTQLFHRVPGTFAVAPDGESAVVAAVDASGAQKLWLHSFRDGTARELPNTSLSVSPFWSPDGRFIAFQAGGKLQRIDVRSGHVNTICECTAGRGTWSQDNIILFASGVVMRVPAGGGTPQPATRLDEAGGEIRHVRPNFLPDGQHFVFSAVNADSSKSVLRIGELASMETRVIGDAPGGAEYAEPGYLIYAANGPLMARPFNAVKGEWAGDPIVVSNQLRMQALGLGAFSVSPSGTLVYDASNLTGESELTWLDSAGHADGVFARINGFHSMSLSANEQLAVVEQFANNTSGIWLVDSQRGTRTRFTFDSDTIAQGHPVWSPDMNRIAYFFGAPGSTTRLMVKAASNTGNAEPLIANDDNRNTRQPTDWSRDGRYLIFEETADRANWNLRYVRIDGDRKPVDIVNTPFSERQGRLSPDGKYLAYSSTESGRNEIFVVTFPDASRRWPISTNGGITPVWRHDGRELYFVDAQEMLMSVEITAGAEFRAGVPKARFPLNSMTSDGTNYAVARDGRVLVARPPGGEGDSLRVVVNVTQLLESLAKKP